MNSILLSFNSCKLSSSRAAGATGARAVSPEPPEGPLAGLPPLMRTQSLAGSPAISDSVWTSVLPF